MKRVVTSLVLGLAVLAGLGLWWVERPLPLRSARVELSIEPGTPTREIARQWVQAGVDVPPWLLYEWFRWSGQARRIQAGSYEIEAGVSAAGLLDRMVRGDQILQMLRVIEGWNFRQVREALAKAPHLRHTVDALSDAQVAALLGIEGRSAEGWLFPDTYAYSPGVSDITVLRRAHLTMQKMLAQAWDGRAANSPLKTPADLLVLASVVEKETGKPEDRPMIAAVFSNRLRIGMPLQSDPTVIYGLGERFDGNLRREDLQADSPWNTYVRRGLPPTPIAMPGRQALQAAAQPAQSAALYFVAKGDGSSAFSSNLADHNRAVNQYQRGGSW
ncbi:endolytic transglycosylase MltG [Ideonella sp. B7]|uniref:endolytic transglycosylase MltG n=1 Tax=Ideonella benzenivorans TaxID=2831643 RepID=UPI001CEDD2CA|nr:endolytic transglycosylase MltG [Ideonella benzenivorans]MCA6216396.1 endolytic transglycosylase MltG [Ideonella benzenivorans]